MPVHSHSWVWAVLPTGCAGVDVRGDAELADVVAGVGAGADRTGTSAWRAFPTGAQAGTHQQRQVRRAVVPAEAPWPENLLVSRGRLRAVLDWEWARPDGLPLGDLLDLVATAQPRTRRLGAGARVMGPIWSLLHSEDPRVRRYCDATGLGQRRTVLEGLVIARWVVVLVRDLQLPRAPVLHDRWAHENVEQPLSFFQEQGWA